MSHIPPFIRSPFMQLPLMQLPVRGGSERMTASFVKSQRYLDIALGLENLSFMILQIWHLSKRRSTETERERECVCLYVCVW
jgi:hypothetical protein